MDDIVYPRDGALKKVKEYKGLLQGAKEKHGKRDGDLYPKLQALEKEAMTIEKDVTKLIK